MRDFNLLFKFGGFPEPYLRGEEKFWRRWQRGSLQRVLYDDIRDLENIKEISLRFILWKGHKFRSFNTPVAKVGLARTLLRQLDLLRPEGRRRSIARDV
jgi:hypothetical protein